LIFSSYLHFVCSIQIAFAEGKGGGGERKMREKSGKLMLPSVWDETPMLMVFTELSLSDRRRLFSETKLFLLGHRL
jgi:hypothetical protein